MACGREHTRMRRLTLVGRPRVLCVKYRHTGVLWAALHHHEESTICHATLIVTRRTQKGKETTRSNSLFSIHHVSQYQLTVYLMS
jgi:hypothetical protein